MDMDISKTQMSKGSASSIKSGTSSDRQIEHLKKATQLDVTCHHPKELATRMRGSTCILAKKGDTKT